MIVLLVLIHCSILVCACFVCFFFFFKQKTAYEMRISDWSSDVCSSDLESLAWSRSLVEANLRGVDSHGVQRLPRYLDLLRTGQIKARPAKIGRASCRERVCQYVSISVVAVSLKKKQHTTPHIIPPHNITTPPTPTPNPPHHPTPH